MLPHDEPKRMTAGELARVIIEDAVDPYDHEAVIHSLVARGKRPDQVHLSIFSTAATIVARDTSPAHAAA